jgi:hypothetical protein
MPCVTHDFFIRYTIATRSGDKKDFLHLRREISPDAWGVYTNLGKSRLLESNNTISTN